MRFFLNTLIFISVIIFLLGWLGLLIIGLSYNFDDDEKDRQDLKSLPKVNPNNTSESGMPEGKFNFPL